MTVTVYVHACMHGYIDQVIFDNVVFVGQFE